MRSFGLVRELDATKADARGLTCAVGAARFTQNALLDEIKYRMALRVEQSWTAFSLHTLWREIRDDVAPWYSECSKEVFQSGAERLSRGLTIFVKSRSGNPARRTNFPLHRKRGVNDSVTYSYISPNIMSGRVHIPRIGDIRLKEPMRLRKNQRVTAITVRPRVGRWFATFHVREDAWEAPEKAEIRNTIGIDLGIGDRVATISNGEIIANPRFYRKGEATLRLANKAVSRKQKGSANRKKAVAHLAKVHYRIACQRADFTHKLTTNLVKNHDEIVLEDLAVAGMSRALKLGKSVHDAALAELRRQITYKSEWYGKTVTVVSRWYPSSRTCSKCGELNSDLKLSVRIWTCLCGATHDRDLNAAINLAASSAVSACRPGSAGRSATKLLVGQEPKAVS